MLEVLCILDTNTFQVKMPPSSTKFASIFEIQVLASGCASSLSGLYPRAALLNHSCSPNCRLVFRSDYTLQVLTSVPVKKGAPLHISYTPPFYSLLARRNILQRGKQFTCQCQRCHDPQELGAHLSSLKCSSCSSGFLFVADPSNLASTWQCDSCPACLSHEDYANMDAALLRIQSRMDKENVAEMKEMLSHYTPSLHPHHALLTETKQHLAAALGRAEGYRWDQLSEADLNLKIVISEELLKLCSILEPGLSKCRGITLLDLAEARGRLLHKTKSGSGLLAGLQKVEKEAEEADKILKLEDEGSIEGNVAKMAREQLAQVRMAVRALKSQFG